MKPAILAATILLTIARLAIAAGPTFRSFAGDDVIARVNSTAPSIENLNPGKAFTIEWWQFIDSAKEALPVFTINGIEVGFRPPPKGMVKDPPRLALFAGDTVRTKVFAYPGKWHGFALVVKDGSAQFFINGCADGDAFSAEKLNGAFLLHPPANPKFEISDVAVFDHALADDRVLAHFKSGIPPHEVTVCGHRGDNTGCPENTNISYVTAISMKAPVVEMDLRLTKDNTLILLHDATVDRTSTSKGKIADMTLEESRKLDTGSKKSDKFKGEPLPTMQTIIDTCRDKTIMMLDLKLEDLAQPLADIKARDNVPDDAWILAPWTDEHGMKLHKVMPHVPMIRLTGKVPTDKYDDAYFAHMKEIGFSGFSIAYPIATQSFIESAHRNGMKIWLWTVNEPSDIAGCILLGGDGVITDNIPKTTKLVGELTSH